MRSLQSRLTSVITLATLMVICLVLHPIGLPKAYRCLSLRMGIFPRTTLWAWERPEDLRAVDRNVAVAYLDQTIVLSPEVASLPRRQPLAYPTTAARIAVVRIEAPSGAPLTTPQREGAVKQLLHSARQPGIAALQIDFDATHSQRAFYKALLSDLRHQMPQDLPLSITALASWCSYDDWIGDLPIDEAVPMLFRMEPDRRRVPADSPWLKIREPLCLGSVGVSTRERWPGSLAGKRVYIFPDRGWREDLALLADRRLQ